MIKEEEFEDMTKYKLCFIATERTEYSIMIEANTPEEAFKLFNDPEYDRGHCEEECFLGMTENESDVQIEGEWIGKDKNDLLTLKRYNKPIKLK